jgi:hypothetical protein
MVTGPENGVDLGRVVTTSLTDDKYSSVLVQSTSPTITLTMSVLDSPKFVPLRVTFSLPLMEHWDGDMPVISGVKSLDLISIERERESEGEERERESEGEEWKGENRGKMKEEER